MNHIIVNQITAALPTDLEQHFPGEQQHHCLPCPHRHHLRDGEGRQQTEGQVFLINKPQLKHSFLTAQFTIHHQQRRQTSLKRYNHKSFIKINDIIFVYDVVNVFIII